jgi:hypothetical protein
MLSSSLQSKVQLVRSTFPLKINSTLHFFLKKIIYIYIVAFLKVHCKLCSSIWFGCRKAVIWRQYNTSCKFSRPPFAQLAWLISQATSTHIELTSGCGIVLPLIINISGVVYQVLINIWWLSSLWKRQRGYSLNHASHILCSKTFAVERNHTLFGFVRVGQRTYIYMYVRTYTSCQASNIFFGFILRTMRRSILQAVAQRGYHKKNIGEANNVFPCLGSHSLYFTSSISNSRRFVHIYTIMQLLHMHE